MSKIVIVAIPAEDDYVWKISSQKIPHMTILNLGESIKDFDSSKIQKFLEHAAKTVLSPFYMDVDYRGPLGVDEADVLFFCKSWDYNTVNSFRTQLLQHDLIQLAYLSDVQFSEWVPHLTLGYPKVPAHPDKLEKGIYTVRFDRIALWTDDFAGPEFRLTYKRVAEEALMNSTIDDIASSIAHFGIKGMRWGHRRSSMPTPVSVSQKPGKKIKTKGGKAHPAHADALEAAKLRQVTKKSGSVALSNQELQTLITRMNLEQQVSRLSGPQKTEGRKFVENELKQVGRIEVKKLLAKKVAKQAAVAAVL